MNKPNAWHHAERVYLQATSGDLSLVQYVTHPRLKGQWKRGEDGKLFYRPPVTRWEWVPNEDVMPFSDLDDALLRVWKVA